MEPLLDLDVVFLAVPHGSAAEWADALERVPDEHLAWNGWVLEKSLA